jgi:N-acetylglutamate synthase-like GNAT family acetyltransferase
VPDPALSFAIRQAVGADIPQIRQLIEVSVRVLQRGDYSTEQIEGALGTVFGVDTRLIEDGTYYLVEAEHSGGKRLVGCGGWSRRKTLFGSDQRPDREDTFLDPRAEAAKIRAFFVHPEWARRGIATQILEYCERAAVAAGFRRFEMGATLTGAPMYAARGYREVERIEVPLANGHSLSVVRMSKQV